MIKPKTPAPKPKLMPKPKQRPVQKPKDREALPIVAHQGVILFADTASQYATRFPN